MLNINISEDRKYTKTPFDGVWFSWLSEDLDSGRMAILKFEKGAKLPTHFHPGWEQIYVLEGVLKINDKLLSKSDFILLDSQTNHYVEAIEKSKYITISQKEGVTVI